jgi:hypothetical protein
MLSWHDFERREPEPAAKGRKLITTFGLGLGNLATVRKDGGPRLHPFCPIFHEGALFGLILLERVLLAEYPPRGEEAPWPPAYTKWRA